MSNLVGRVHFNATLDGKGMPRDAERVGREAGLAGAKGYNKEFDKEFQRGLTNLGRQQLGWAKRRGETDGLAYGRGLDAAFKKFSDRMERNFDIFQGLQVDSNFLDEWIDKTRRLDPQIDDLRSSLDDLARSGQITDTQFRNSTRTLEDWADAQRNVERSNREIVRLQRIWSGQIGDSNREWEESITLSDRMRESFTKLHFEGKGLSDTWKGLSHNTRQWTLIIGAVTAALPELAGLSSAAGSGLLTLGGALTSAGVGAGSLVSGILGLSADIKKMPAELRPAAKAYADFTKTFSELNKTITERTFAGTEQEWESLGRTITGLAPAFGEVADVNRKLFQDFARYLEPGTEGFQQLSDLVRNSAPLWDQLARSSGTLGKALLQAFNDPAMQRSISELLGWIDELVSGFEEFTRGDSFDDWLRHGRAVFGEFGQLLNTTGRLLNDLVTPESINRLTTFMDNIGDFLDTGGRGILQFADELNAFGVIAEILADVGAALEPLREPMAELAGAISGSLIPAIEGGTYVLSGFATVVAPVVEGLTDLLNAVPAEGWQVIGGGLAAVGSGLLLLKGAGTLAGLATSLTAVDAEGKKAVGTLGRVGRTAGLIGAGVAGVTILAGGLEELHRSMTGIEDLARNAISDNDTLRSSYETLGKSAFGASYGLTDVSGALDQLASVGTGLEDFFPTFIATFSDTGRQASQLAASLGELDAPLAKLANQSISAASDQFQSWATELGATDQQVLNMINSMPEFKSVLENVALQTEGAAGDQELLNAALGRGVYATEDQTGALKEMESQAGLTESQVDDLASAIRGFGDESLSSREANRQFQEAIDQLSESVKINGDSLDIGTQKGRDNQAALDRIAESALEAAAAKVQLTGDEDDAAAAILKGRDALIKQLEKFGITGQAAEDYADELGLIPDDVSSEAEFISDPAKRQVQAWKDLLASIPRSIVTTPRLQGTGGTAPNATASGGLFHSGQVRLIGEAGPEAVVPLNRALNQVDPSVRWLSAVAQGLTPPGMASGGTVGGGGTTVEAGAIVVEDRSGDSIQTAHEVLLRLTERITG